MKKAFTYFLVILMAALVFYGGAGVNVISFCCDDCRMAGVEVLVEDKCCEIHGHTHEGDHHHHHHHAAGESLDSCLDHPYEKCCDLERVDFDWDDVPVSINPLEPVSFSLLLTGLHDVLVIPLPLVREISTVMPTGPPLCPREYLSLLTTLLI